MSTDYTNVNGYLVPSFALPTGSSAHGQHTAVG